VPSLGHAWIAAAAAAACLLGEACKPSITSGQCDELLDRYSHLVIGEKYPDASAPEVVAEEQRVKVESQNDDTFKNCGSLVSVPEFNCAMRAPTADAVEKCLE